MSDQDPTKKTLTKPDPSDVEAYKKWQEAARKLFTDYRDEDVEMDRISDKWR